MIAAQDYMLKKMRRNRPAYRRVEDVKHKALWIEEKYKPVFMLHLTFSKPTGKKAARKVLDKFMNRMARFRRVKQHVQYFIYGGRQENREEYSYHYHIAMCFEDKLPPVRKQEIVVEMYKLWRKLGGGKIQIDHYHKGEGALHYAMLYHPDEDDYVACNARQPCRSGTCRKASGL